MNNTVKKSASRLKIPLLLAYLLTFYGLWTLWEFFGAPWLQASVHKQWLVELLSSGVVKNAVWTLPAILLIGRYEPSLQIGLKEMFSAPVQWLKYLPVFVGFTVYLLFGVLWQGSLAINETFSAADVISVLFVGITEELVFRGWLLNGAVCKRKWLPILVNALLFLTIHFPIWIVEGSFVANFTGLGFLCLLGLSVIFSWSFLKSRSILVPIALHMYWDLLMFLFY